MGEILTALEGRFSIIDEVVQRDQLDKVQKVINGMVWDRINGQVNAFLESITLADLVDGTPLHK